MLYLNLRQTNILHYLCLNDGVELEHLSSLFNASTRTIQSDIMYINEELRSSGFSVVIKNKRNRGYDLDYSQVEEYRRVRRQCEEYLDSSINVKYGSIPRVSYLIRHLLFEDNFVLSEELVDYIHVSQSTLKMDLKEVRQVLRNYKMEILSVPYHGMKVVGNELNRINCLVDFCDISNIYEENPIFLEFSLEQYKIKRDNFARSRKLLSSLLTKSSIKLNEYGFRRIFIYLNLLMGGYRSSEVAPELSILKDTPEYKLSQSILRQFGIDTINEVYHLAVFIIAHLDSNSEFSEDSHGLWYKSAHDVVEKLNESLFVQIDLNFQSYPMIENVLKLFIYKYMLRMKFDFKEFEYSLEYDEIITQMPATKSLAIHILSTLEKMFGYHFDSYLLRDLAMLLFSQIFQVPNQYNPVKILVVGQHGHLSAESILYRLDLRRFNPNFECVLPFELEGIDFKDYDCVFYTSMHHRKLEDIPILSFQLDFYDALKMQKKLWESILLKRRKKDYIFPLLKQSIQRIVLSKTHQIDEVIKDLKGNDHQSEVIDILIESSLRHMNERIVSKTRVCCVFTKKPCKYPVIRFIFKYPLQHENCLIEELVVMSIHTNNDVLTIKQADSVSKRIMNREIAL